jgi:hypothetical protein
MNLNQVLPFVSTLVMVIFTLSVFQRWLVRKKPHFLFWTAGLAMFSVGSFAEAYFAVTGWSAPLFFGWYLLGAALNAAWLGHGTLLLLIRKRWVNILTVLLVIGSLATAFLLIQTMPSLDITHFSKAVAISEQYQEIMPPVNDGGAVRLTTPVFNIYGLVTLVGGAIWSAWLFHRKKVLPNRVIGNVLIAIGALTIASASMLTRLGLGAYLYIGELIAAVLMYAGFLVASAPATEAERVSEPATAQ